MKEKNIKLIKNINKMILEIHKKLKNINEEEFYDNIELTNMCTDCIFKINDNIKNINQNIKNKYKNINWNVIEENIYNDKVFKDSIKLSKIWNLSNNLLYNELYNQLNIILNDNRK